MIHCGCCDGEHETVAEILRRLDHEVTTCSDGAEAMEHYRGAWEKTDLVILDMIMPTLAGPETFRAMRAINPRVKVILSSAFDLTAEEESLAQEAFGFLKKPYLATDLERAVARALSATAGEEEIR